MEIDKKIIERYNQPGPRYTSYPPANLFHEVFSGEEYLDEINRSNNEGFKGVSLYVHVPFCPRLCHFCGCNTQLGTDKEFIARYFDSVLQEIERVAEKIDKNRVVTQVHWGGGTPNSVEWRHIEKVMDSFYSKFKFSGEAEIAMECSPAYLDYDDIDIISKLGFNRISLGIQDFNRDVLKIVNRTPPRLPVDELVSYIRKSGIQGVNMDFIYGLPGQELDGYLDTLKKAVDIRPDRLVTFSYAHVPWVKEKQKILEKTGIPGPDLKLEMLVNGFDYLKQSGYVPIGMDHFALPEDEMAKAFSSNTLHRNFQGYCTLKHTGQVYSFGASAISQLHSVYVQNVKEANAYIKLIENGQLAVNKGYRLNKDEKLIRNAINQLMCNGYLNFEEEANKSGLERRAG